MMRYWSFKHKNQPDACRKLRCRQTLRPRPGPNFGAPEQCSGAGELGLLGWGMLWSVCVIELLATEFGQGTKPRIKHMRKRITIMALGLRCWKTHAG